MIRLFNHASHYGIGDGCGVKKEGPKQKQHISHKILDINKNY